MAGEVFAMTQQSLVLDSDEPALPQLTELPGLQQLWSLVAALATAGFCSQQDCAAAAVFTGTGTCTCVQQQACLGVPYKNARRTRSSGRRRFKAVPRVPDYLISSIRLMTTAPLMVMPGRGAYAECCSRGGAKALSTHWRSNRGLPAQHVKRAESVITDPASVIFITGWVVVDGMPHTQSLRNGRTSYNSSQRSSLSSNQTSQMFRPTFPHTNVG